MNAVLRLHRRDGQWHHGSSLRSTTYLPKRPHLLTYGILPSSDRRLACTAFIDVFRRRQSRHSVLLAWLHAQLGVPGVRGQQRRLERVVVQKKKNN